MSTTEQSVTGDVLDEMRRREQAATRGPWDAQESDDHWQLFGAVAPYMHPLQILKAPKHGTPYAEYWPAPADAAFIVAARSDIPRLLRVVKAVRDLCRGTDGNWLEPSSPLPVGEFQAALALLDAEPTP